MLAVVSLLDMVDRDEDDSDIAVGMMIPDEQTSRGWIKWGLVFIVSLALVGGLLALVFYQFVASWWLAILVVGLMLGYMILLAKTAQGSTDRRDW